MTFIESYTVGLSICKMMMVCYDCMCMNWRLFDRVVCLVMYVCLVVLCFTTHASSCALSRFLVICKHITNIGPKPAAAGQLAPYGNGTKRKPIARPNLTSVRSVGLISPVIWRLVGLFGRQTDGRRDRPTDILFYIIDYQDTIYIDRLK